MLAVVRTPHTEISLSGSGTSEILELLRSRFPVEILDVPPPDDADESVDLFETDFWHENKHHVLAGYRLKHDMSQEELAKKSGISQSVISQYESGKRKITMRAAVKLGKALGEAPEKLITD